MADSKFKIQKKGEHEAGPTQYPEGASIRTNRGHWANRPKVAHRIMQVSSVSRSGKCSMLTLLESRIVRRGAGRSRS